MVDYKFSVVHKFSLMYKFCQEKNRRFLTFSSEKWIGAAQLRKSDISLDLKLSLRIVNKPLRARPADPLEIQEVFEQVGALGGQETFGVELHAF